MDPIARVKHLMRQTYKCPLLIEQLCELVGEPYHAFRKQFRRIEGMTLSEFYQRLRLQEAERLLGHSDKLIFEVADEIGLSDEGNLTNWFKNKTGLTPTAYRQQLERGEGRFLIWSKFTTKFHNQNSQGFFLGFLRQLVNINLRFHSRGGQFSKTSHG